MLVKSTYIRASREARPHAPQNSVDTRMIVDARIAEFEEKGLTKSPLSQGEHRLPTASASKTKSSKRSQHSSHVLSLHSKTLCGSYCESTWLTFQRRIALRHTQLAYWAFKAASVRISLVNEKSLNSTSPKAGSSQQTTRVNTQPLVSTWSTQSTAIAIAFGAARSLCEDPRGVGLSSPNSLLHSHLGSFHATACTELMAANVHPLRMSSYSIIETINEVALRELADGHISNSITHDESGAGATALRVLCQRASDLKQGDAVWAILALTLVLSQEAEGRRILRDAGVAEYDLAVSRVLTDFGHSEVTRRFRLATSGNHVYGDLAPPLESEVDSVLLQLDNDAPNDNDSECSTLTDQYLRKRGKRKRSPLMPSTSLETAANWAHALTSSNQIHVLLMLIASTKAAARSAAETTLRHQTPEYTDRIITSVSQDQAINSREHLRCLFRQTDCDVPCVAAWRLIPSAPDSRVHAGVARSSSDLKQTMFCFGKISRWTVPGNVILVNVSAYHLRGSDTSTGPLPGFMEASLSLQNHEKLTSSKRTQERVDRMRSLIKGETTSAALTGISRSEIVLAMRVVVSRSSLLAGQRLVDKVREQASRMDTAGADETCSDVNTSPTNFGIHEEPFSSPSNNLAQALQVSEVLRVLHKGKDHKGDPARAVYADDLFVGESNDTDMSEHDKPLQMITIVDFEVEQRGDPEPVKSRPDAALLPIAVRFSVSGENPIRIPEAVSALWTRHEGEAIAVLLHAAAQVSLVNEEARNALAGSAISASASAKRVILPDFRNLYLTVYQAFRIGHRNVKTSFSGNSWAGAYPAGVEIGSGGGLGKGSVFITADRRHHGKFLDTQETADSYSLRIAEGMVKQVSEKHYDFIPPQCRGVPHVAVPGVHAFLDESVAGMERLRQVAKITARTVDSIQVLPVGPFSENLAPRTTNELDHTANMCFRNPADRLSTDGRSFMFDMTLDDVSVFREPLVQRAGIQSVCDNPYASAHEHLSSWFEAASILSVMGTCLLRKGSPSEVVERLRETIAMFHQASGTQSPNEAYVASKAVVLLSAMYPTNFGVSEASIELPYAKAAGPAMRAFRQKSSFALRDLVSEELVSKASAYWSKFSMGAWDRLRPLLESLVRLNGTCDMTVAQLQAMKGCVDEAIRAAWFLRPDAISINHPLYGLNTIQQISHLHVSPVYSHCEKTNRSARGSLVGMKPGSFRSLLCMLMAADSVEEVQVYRNEGGLLLRPSSAADIYDHNGKPRTNKSCSPIGVEGDEAAYGTRKSKLIGCKLQRLAWKLNLRLIMPLCVDVSTPLPYARRQRGDWGEQHAVCETARRIALSGETSAEHTEAKLASKMVFDAITSRRAQFLSPANDTPLK